MTTLAEIEKSEWFQSRPLCIQEAVRRLPPTQKYRMRETNQLVSVYSYSEPEDEGAEVTVTVHVHGRLDAPEEMQALFSGSNVFGVHLSDLEPLT